MKVLGIDTSGNVASVALIENDKLISEYTINYKLTHSQTLMPMIDAICKSCELDLATIDVIAVASGPGSFTGLRIGAATAKGIAHSLDKKIADIPTLDGLAYNICYTDNIVCPIMDARRNQVYTALYEWENNTIKRITEHTAVEIQELMKILKEQSKKIVFLGDGVEVYKQQIEENLDKDMYLFAPPSCNIQRASNIACLGKEYAEQGKLQDYINFTPFYLRKSQAEREYEAKEKGMK